MKTFKLISLDIIGETEKVSFPLIDGLIIDREDEKGFWVVECLIDTNFNPYILQLQKSNDKVMIQAKITKATNKPATFSASIIDINYMEYQMNVVFIGEMIK